MAQELALQDNAERQWVSLLQTMAPSCHSATVLRGQITSVLEQTLNGLIPGAKPAEAPDVKVPPPVEILLQDISKQLPPARGGARVGQR